MHTGKWETNNAEQGLANAWQAGAYSEEERLRALERLAAEREEEDPERWDGQS